MRRPEREWMCRPLVKAVASLTLTVTTAAAAVAADTTDAMLFRYRAPIHIEQPGALVRVPLPVDVYARSLRGPLADLRVVDARGQRVPFGLLEARAEERTTSERWRDVQLYALPPRPEAGGRWAAPVEVIVDADGRTTLRTRGGNAATAAGSPGWLIDLGERERDAPRPARLQLAWGDAAAFSAPYTLEHSADLREWRAAGGGQLLSLLSDSGPLTQPDVPLPAQVERFVRLAWSAPAPHPLVIGARADTPLVRSHDVDAQTEIRLTASAQGDDDAAHALHFDIGAVVPIARLEAQWSAGNHVLPVRVQVRARSEAEWAEVASTVFYRLEQPDGEAQSSSPLALQTTARYLRLMPDVRAGTVRTDALQLVVHAPLASLVFTAQGEAPYELLVGAAQADPGALPLASVVPDQERERGASAARAPWGQASVGAFSEVSEAAERARREDSRAALRPWLLWSVLVAGVLVLAVMVWRLVRGSAPSAPPSTSDRSSVDV